MKPEIRRGTPKRSSCSNNLGTPLRMMRSKMRSAMARGYNGSTSKCALSGRSRRLTARWPKARPASIENRPAAWHSLPGYAKPAIRHHIGQRAKYGKGRKAHHIAGDLQHHFCQRIGPAHQRRAFFAHCRQRNSCKEGENQYLQNIVCRHRLECVFGENREDELGGLQFLHFTNFGCRIGGGRDVAHRCRAGTD